jgi:hypothetical protein
MIMTTTDDRRAALTAELAAMDTEDREAEVRRRVEDRTFGEVITHLVANSAGYPTPTDRDVDLAVVARQFHHDKDRNRDADSAKAAQQPSGAGKR